MTPVEFHKEYPGEVPFEMGGQKWIYCWGKYPNGKTDIAVYSYANDLAYDYNDFRAAFNLQEGYQQPQMFMDIKETQLPTEAPINPEEFQDDPTIGQVMAQNGGGLGIDNSGNEEMINQMIAQHDQEKQGQDAVAAQYDPLEENIAPEAKEFMGTEKVQAATGDNGLAGSVETGDGPKTPEAKEISSLLDRMKELTKIMTNKPDSQWEKAGISSGGLMDAPKEVDPVDAVRAETETGAPSIEVLKQELRPENPIITKSAPKSDSSSSSSAPAEKSEGGEKKESGKPWEKKEEKSEEPKEEKTDEKEEGDDDKKKDKVNESVEDAIEEVTTHHIGASRRNVAGNDEEDVNEEVSEEVAGMTDDEILESEDTEKLYEAMVKYKQDPIKFMRFKRRMDEITSERRLNEAISKMRKRF
jgi:hypothetical protein